MKKKKNIIIGGVIILILIASIILTLTFTNSKDENKLTLFSEDDLIEDYYVIDDYKKDLVYENKIYIPNYMTKRNQKITTATYLYKNDDYSLQLDYKTYLTEDDLKDDFINDETFKEKDFYYYLDKGNSVKVYLKNENGYYQTIEINIYSRSDDNIYSIDSSYKNLLKNLTTTKKEISDYSINKENGYFTDSINYNYYVDETDKVSVKIDYKVSSEKYGSNYDPESKYQNLYLDDSSASFYEGEITADISSVQKQTRIRTYISNINNLDINKEAVSNLQYPLNQTAFKNVTEDMVKIEINSLQYNDKLVSYYKTVSDNNNCHNERIYAYYPIQGNIYYIVQIYGGDNKNLDVNMIEEFLPTSVEIQ